MLSRYAEGLYWVGRYVERAENTARFLDVASSLSIDEPTHPEAPWQMVLASTGEHAHYTDLNGTIDERSVLNFFCHDTRNDNSILTCLQKARENARGLRPILSSEMWEHLNRTYLEAHGCKDESTMLDLPSEYLTGIKQGSHLFWGLHDGTMTHGEGWHFARLGSFIERADQISRILSGYLTTLVEIAPFEHDHEVRLAALLKSVSGFEMYRKRHGTIRDATVASFLLRDGEFPRSVRFCLSMAASSLKAIVAAPLGAELLPCERHLGRLVSTFDYADPDFVARPHLELALTLLRNELSDIHKHIEAAFFLS